MWRMAIAMAAVAAGLAQAAGPDTGRVDRVLELMQIIRTADEPQLAMAAYARANSLDRRSVELHSAYIRRMLQMGLSQAAYYGSRNLLEVDRENPLALAVVGYKAGREGDFASAFSAMLEALPHRRDDPSLLHNAGQLAAWYDLVQPTPRVSDGARRALATHREALMEQDAFAQAYQEVRQAHQREQQVQAELREQMDRLEQQALALREAVMQYESQLRDLETEIQARYTNIDRLQGQYLYAFAYVPGNQGDSGYWPPYGYGLGSGLLYPYQVTAARQELRFQIDQEFAAVDQLEGRRNQMRREGREVVAQWRALQRQIGEIRDRLANGMEVVARSFRWDPPAIDGKTTPEREWVQRDHATLPEFPEDAQQAALSRLRLAQLYHEHHMPARAVDILQELLRSYPETAAAGKARELLGLPAPRLGSER